MRRVATKGIGHLLSAGVVHEALEAGGVEREEGAVGVKGELVHAVKFACGHIADMSCPCPDQAELTCRGLTVDPPDRHERRRHAECTCEHLYVPVFPHDQQRLNSRLRQPRLHRGSRGCVAAESKVVRAARRAEPEAAYGTCIGRVMDVVAMSASGTENSPRQLPRSSGAQISLVQP